MDMDALLNKLENHTREIRDIMLTAQSSFKIVEYLYLDKTDLELEYISHSKDVGINPVDVGLPPDILN